MAWGTGPRTLTRGELAGQTFATQQAYQNALAAKRGAASYAALRKTTVQRFQPRGWIPIVLQKTLGQKPPPGYPRVTQSGFNRLLRAVRAEYRTVGIDRKRAGGALAKLFEYLGRRPPDASYRVGATP